LATKLAGGNKDAAERLKAALGKATERDLVLRLVWQGQADLDLKVQEPNGSVCSWLNRQTVGGGTLIGDTLTDGTQEVYVAAQGFGGEYKVTVDVAWGKPLGNKAKLEVIQHQGTPQETVRPITINFADANTVTVPLKEGRRTELASVPPPESLQRSDPLPDMPSTDRVLTQLRNLTDPGEGPTNGITGSVACNGTPSPGKAAPKPYDSRGEQVRYQTRVEPFVTNTADLTAQATISADRRYVRLSLNATFNGVTGTRLQPGGRIPVIPGGSFGPP
jgi:hypothetical protein